jgi:hypothetical protein
MLKLNPVVGTIPIKTKMVIFGIIGVFVRK